MEINTIHLKNHILSEYISPNILIHSAQDALDIMANSPSNMIVLYEHNFEKEFFDLRTQKLGEILQKFTNYFVKLAIIGDFDKYSSESLKAFIYESNKGTNYLFVKSLEDVKEIWSNQK